MVTSINCALLCMWWCFAKYICSFSKTNGWFLYKLSFFYKNEHFKMQAIMRLDVPFEIGFNWQNWLSRSSVLDDLIHFSSNHVYALFQTIVSCGTYVLLLIITTTGAHVLKWRSTIFIRQKLGSSQGRFFKNVIYTHSEVFYPFWIILSDFTISSTTV